jgi:hypothetical protein
MRRFVPRLRRWAATQGLPGADDNSPFPFASFIAYIESQAEGRRNQHWDTQTSVLLARHIPYRHVYHMETDFARGMSDTLEVLGIDPTWTRAQVERPTNASGKVTEPAYTPELAERVHTLYQEDFERFGYDRNSWTSLYPPP